MFQYFFVWNLYNIPPQGGGDKSLQKWDFKALKVTSCGFWAEIPSCHMRYFTPRTQLRYNQEFASSYPTVNGGPPISVSLWVDFFDHSPNPKLSGTFFVSWVSLINSITLNTWDWRFGRDIVCPNQSFQIAPYFSYAPCIECLPTFGWFSLYMYVHFTHMDPMGYEGILVTPSSVHRSAAASLC